MEIIPVLKFGTVALSALLIFAAHWFPWPMVFGRKLRRLEAYAAGTMAIFVPATLAVFAGLDELDAVDALMLFWLALIGAGGATFAAEDDIAVILSGKSALDALRLLIRGLQRRGILDMMAVDRDSITATNDDLAAIARALEIAHERLKEARQASI